MGGGEICFWGFSIYFLADCLVLAGPDLRQSDPMSSFFGRHSVQVNGHRKFSGQTTSKLLGASDAILNIDPLFKKNTAPNDVNESSFSYQTAN